MQIAESRYGLDKKTEKNILVYDLGGGTLADKHSVFSWSLSAVTGEFYP